MLLNLVKPLRKVDYAVKTYNGLLASWQTLEALIPSESLKWLLEAVLSPFDCWKGLEECILNKLEGNPLLL
jgi:hypothetical protein